MRCDASLIKYRRVPSLILIHVTMHVQPILNNVMVLCKLMP